MIGKGELAVILSRRARCTFKTAAKTVKNKISYNKIILWRIWVISLITTRARTRARVQMCRVTPARTRFQCISITSQYCTCGHVQLLDDAPDITRAWRSRVHFPHGLLPLPAHPAVEFLGFRFLYHLEHAAHAAHADELHGTTAKCHHGLASVVVGIVCTIGDYYCSLVSSKRDCSQVADWKSRFLPLFVLTEDKSSGPASCVRALLTL